MPLGTGDGVGEHVNREGCLGDSGIVRDGQRREHQVGIPFGAVGAIVTRAICAVGNRPLDRHAGLFFHLVNDGYQV